MKIYRNFEEIDYKQNTVLTVGTFDGIHLGHQQIIRRLLEISRNDDCRALVITIEPHPQVILNPDNRKPIKILTTISERLKLLEKFGVEHTLIIPFTLEFAQTPPDFFIKYYLSGKVGLKKILIGYDHLFGKDREGNEDLLGVLAAGYNFEVEKIKPLSEEELIVSSTKIRNSIMNYDLDLANKLLGYNYFLDGTVVRGDGRGAQIGFPTANVKSYNLHKLLPADGVYLVEVEFNGTKKFGMANIGTRPTFTNDKEVVLEINIFDFDGDIYTRQMTVNFLKFLRRELKFPDKDSLLGQIAVDKKNCIDLINKFYNYAKY